MKLRIEGVMKFITSFFLNTCLEKVNLSTLHVFLSCHLPYLYCYSDSAVLKTEIVEFSGKIRQSNSFYKVHIGFILNQRKIFCFLCQNYRYIFSFEFLTWRWLCVLYDTSYVISYAEGQPGVIKRYYLLFSARAAPHFFLFLFFFFFFAVS